MIEVVIKMTEWGYCVYPLHEDEDERQHIVHTHHKNPLEAIQSAFKFLHENYEDELIQGSNQTTNI